jgi:hypothetical protein
MMWWRKKGVDVKKYLQACEVGGSIYGKKRQTGQQPFVHRSRIRKQDVMAVYNKFYRDQVAALYKAIHNAK